MLTLTPRSIRSGRTGLRGEAGRDRERRGASEPGARLRRKRRERPTACAETTGGASPRKPSRWSERRSDDRARQGPPDGDPVSRGPRRFHACARSKPPHLPRSGGSFRALTGPQKQGPRPQGGWQQPGSVANGSSPKKISRPRSPKRRWRQYASANSFRSAETLGYPVAYGSPDPKFRARKLQARPMNLKMFIQNEAGSNRKHHRNAS